LLTDGYWPRLVLIIMRLIKISEIWLVVVLILLIAGSCQAGLGISPSQWIEKHALRGSRIEKIFTLSRAEPKEDLYFKAEIEGEIKDWIKIDKGLEFTMPKGEQQFPIKVIIDVPQDAEYRGYQGGVRLKSESKTETVEGIGVALHALIQIDLTVSEEEFLDYEILQIAIPKQEEGKPLKVVLKIWNRGNVEAKPTKLTADFWDKYKSEQLESTEITDFSEIKAVAPFSEGEITLSLPIQFEPEQYWANVKVYHDEEILKSEDIFFEIVEAGGLEKEILPGAISTEIREGSKGYIGIGLIVLIILAFLGWRERKKIGIIFKKREKETKSVPDEKKTIEVIDLSKPPSRERPPKRKRPPRKNM